MSQMGFERLTETAESLGLNGEGACLSDRASAGDGGDVVEQRVGTDLQAVVPTSPVSASSSSIGRSHSLSLSLSKPLDICGRQRGLQVLTVRMIDAFLPLPHDLQLTYCNGAHAKHFCTHTHKCDTKGEACGGKGI